MTSFETVQEYLAAQPMALRTIGEALVPIIDAVLPGTGALWQGHPVWSLGEAPGRNPVCLLKAYTSYVTFGLWRGREIGDGTGTGTGTGTGRMELTSGMAHVKLRNVADIDAERFTDWLTQARDLERARA